MGRGRNREPIIVEVHYPTTEEGWKVYNAARQDFVKIQISMLEKHFGEKNVEAAINYMKEEVHGDKN